MHTLHMSSATAFCHLWLGFSSSLLNLDIKLTGKFYELTGKFLKLTGKF